MHLIKGQSQIGQTKLANKENGIKVADSKGVIKVLKKIDQTVMTPKCHTKIGKVKNQAKQATFKLLYSIEQATIIQRINFRFNFLCKK